LDRFLILGDEHGTYYAGGRTLSAESAVAVRVCLAEDGLRTVQSIGAIARSGRASHPGPVLLALAMGASQKYADARTNAAALEALPEVARSAAHLKKFAGFVTAERGWGRSLRNAFARWYVEKPVRELAHQMLKQRRGGRWSHADLLRLSHPKPADRAQNVLFRWAVEGGLEHAPADLLSGDLKQVYGYELGQKATDAREVINLIEDYQLTHEMIPERWLATADVWEALLETMPYCALLRHLGKLTAVGLIAPQGETTALVAARLLDHRRMARAKANPFTLLSTLLDYRKNDGVPAIARALEQAFYASFEYVKPAGGLIDLRLDPGALIPSTILAMRAARTEPGARIQPVTFSKEDKLDAVMKAIAAHPPVSEGTIRVKGGDREVVIAPNASEPPMRDLRDPNIMQIAGFDATVPALVSDFLREGPF
jgi:60 kDa SS-A/Ro ribonucleoprotein